MTIEHNGQEIEYKEIQKIHEALMQINGAMRRLNIDTDEVELTLPKEEFVYIKHVIELTDNHNFKKYYKSLSDIKFKLGGMLIKKGGV